MKLTSPKKIISSTALLHMKSCSVPVATQTGKIRSSTEEHDPQQYLQDSLITGFTTVRKQEWTQSPDITSVWKKKIAWNNRKFEGSVGTLHRCTYSEGVTAFTKCYIMGYFSTAGSPWHKRSLKSSWNRIFRAPSLWQLWWLWFRWMVWWRI